MKIVSPLAASLLMDLGAQAFPSLRILACSNRPECAWFVPTITGLPDVQLQNRMEVLTYLVKSPHIEYVRASRGQQPPLS